MVKGEFSKPPFRYPPDNITNLYGASLRNYILKTHALVFSLYSLLNDTLNFFTLNIIPVSSKININNKISDGRFRDVYLHRSKTIVGYVFCHIK